MYFIVSGNVAIGFMHPTKGFIKVLEFYKNSYICSFNVINNHKSEYRFVSKEKTDTFALEKTFLLQIFERFEEIGGRIKSDQIKREKEIFKRPIKL